MLLLLIYSYYLYIYGRLTGKEDLLIENNPLYTNMHNNSVLAYVVYVE